MKHVMTWMVGIPAAIIMNFFVFDLDEKMALHHWLPAFFGLVGIIILGMSIFVVFAGRKKPDEKEDEKKTDTKKK